MHRLYWTQLLAYFLYFAELNYLHVSYPFLFKSHYMSKVQSYIRWQDVNILSMKHRATLRRKWSSTLREKQTKNQCKCFSFGKTELKHAVQTHVLFHPHKGHKTEMRKLWAPKTKVDRKKQEVHTRIVYRSNDN